MMPFSPFFKFPYDYKLQFDDLLILALIFCLYKEDVQDNYLFVILFMLLLN
jgi:hypothetical protein